jgi:hypothetical protein
VLRIMARWGGGREGGGDLFGGGVGVKGVYLVKMVL